MVYVGARVSEKLPQLLSVRGIMDETGLKRAGAEALMRALPKIEIPGHRASYVRRGDVHRLLEENTRMVVTGRRRAVFAVERSAA